jgi:hypothetical protein
MKPEEAKTKIEGKRILAGFSNSVEKKGAQRNQD